MIIEIEVYKGQSISYDDDIDKFTCDISIEDKYKSTKRLSLKDVRKEIDQFIKLNADFKPIQALLLDSYKESNFEIVTIEALRTDGKLVINKKGWSSKSYYGAKEIKYLMNYDTKIIEEYKQLDAIFEKAREDFSKARKKLCEKLKPLDLSKYQHIISQEG